MHAALGGASAVTSVHIAPRAIDAVATNFALNNIAGAHHQHICMDGFDYLAKSRHAGRSWDLVIADPPSFAPNERAKPAALAAYKRLLLECVSVVAPGGYVALASCSSHISEADLIDLCAKHVPGVQLHVVMSAATDYLVIPGFPEGRYLKFLLLGRIDRHLGVTRSLHHSFLVDLKPHIRLHTRGAETYTYIHAYFVGCWASDCHRL